MNIEEEIAEWVAEEVTETSEQELIKILNEELINNNNLLPLIINKIKDFLKKLEEYDRIVPNKVGSIGQELKKLELKKEFIYNDFFVIQNLINLYLGQKIVITSVVKNEDGKREIRIVNNDIEHLGIQRGIFKNNPFYKLGYDVSNHYQLLKNSLPEEQNQGLQMTAYEVERRYMTYKHNILWFYPNEWQGYRSQTKGPINEAFVNFYIHNIQLNNSLEHNINTFMLDNEYGAIKADATKGYLIGDVSSADGSFQYAVKGAFGSPQGVKQIIKEFKKMQEENFSLASFYHFIEKFTTEELNKKYKPQIKMLSRETIDKILSEAQEKLTIN